MDTEKGMVWALDCRDEDCTRMVCVPEEQTEVVAGMRFVRELATVCVVCGLFGLLTSIL